MADLTIPFVIVSSGFIGSLAFNFQLLRKWSKATDRYESLRSAFIKYKSEMSNPYIAPAPVITKIQPMAPNHVSENMITGSLPAPDITEMYARSVNNLGWPGSEYATQNYAMCGGCGHNVEIEPDGITLKPHDCPTEPDLFGEDIPSFLNQSLIPPKN